MKRKERIFADENGPKKVGRFYKSIGIEFSYLKVRFDEDKWADASCYLPKDFDLCYCKIENIRHICAGWHNGNIWDGVFIKPEHKIEYWKLNYDH